MKRIHLLLILLTIISSITIWHMRNMPITLDEHINSCLSVLESTREEIITNVELRGEAYHRFLELVKRGGRQLGDECIRVLASEDPDKDSIRRAQLVLAQLDLTEKQIELLNNKAKKDPVIWTYVRLREKQTDHLGGGYPGVRVEYLPVLLDVVRRHRNLGSYFSEFETITDFIAIDLDDDGDLEFVIKSADWGANNGTSYARILAADSNGMVEISAGNPFIVRVLLLHCWTTGTEVIAIPDRFYLESLSSSAARYVGTLAIHYSLCTYSQGYINKIGEIWMPLP